MKTSFKYQNFALLALISYFFLLFGCVAGKQPVNNAVDVDSTSAACFSIAKKLNSAFPVQGITIQVTEDFINERQTGAQLPYSAIISDGLTRELSKLGANISVEQSGTRPVILFASYSQANGIVIIDAKLRRVETNMDTSDVAVAEAALPASSLDPHWLKVTLQTVADSLIRQLGEAPMAGRNWLRVTGSIPGATKQPSLMLGRKFDIALMDAITRTQTFTVVTGSLQNVELRSSYIVFKNGVQLNAWLERAGGKRLASATASLDKSALPSELFTPMANSQISTCINYKQHATEDPPASSAEAEQLQNSIKAYLQELGITAVSCSDNSEHSQIAASVTLLPVGTTRDGYKFTTAKIMVEILDNKGRQLGNFQNQARQGFSSNQSKANIKAIDKATNDGLKAMLATSLLSVSP